MDDKSSMSLMDYLGFVFAFFFPFSTVVLLQSTIQSSNKNSPLTSIKLVIGEIVEIGITTCIFYLTLILTTNFAPRQVIYDVINQTVRI